MSSTSDYAEITVGDSAIHIFKNEMGTRLIRHGFLSPGTVIMCGMRYREMIFAHDTVEVLPVIHETEALYVLKRDVHMLKLLPDLRQDTFDFG